MRFSNFPTCSFNPQKRFGRRFSHTFQYLKENVKITIIKNDVKYVNFLSSGVRPEWGTVLWFQSDIPLKLFMNLSNHNYLSNISIPNDLIFEDQNYLELKSHMGHIPQDREMLKKGAFFIFFKLLCNQTV